MLTVLVLKLEKGVYFCRQTYGSLSVCSNVLGAHAFNNTEELSAMYHTNYAHAWKKLLMQFPEHELITKLVIPDG
jgi:hypothetical protein